ncbi:gypsy type transposase [Tanacetum coccineum]
MNDYSLFVKHDSDIILVLLVYVDEFEKFKKLLAFKFQIKDLGSLKYFLGIEVLENKNGLCLSQRKPDTSYDVHCLSQHMHSPLQSHFSAGLRVLRKLVCGFCVYLCGNFISWKSKKQATISGSSAKAEYRCMASTTCEVLWLINLISRLGVEGMLPVPLYCDSTSAIQIVANPIFHKKTKHFKIDVHLVREKVDSCAISTVESCSEDLCTSVFVSGGATGAALKILIITSLKCVLTQEHLDAICAKYFVPEEVHPQLPSSDATMHERPTGKVGMYTRFFDYANYQMDLNAFILTADPRKVRIVERARAENERPIVTMAKHCTVTLLPTSVVRSSGELSASVKREFVGDASVGDGGDQGFTSIGGQDNVEPTVPVTEHVETEIPRPKCSKKKRVTRGSEKMPAASHPPKRLRADYGTTGGSATGGKSPSVLNRLLQDSRLMVEHGVLALPTLPFITSSVIASPLEEGGDRTDSVTGPSLQTVCPSARVVVLSDSSHHSGAKSTDPEVNSLVRSAAPVMTKATTVATVATTVAIPADVSKDKSAPHPSIFGSSSSSEKTDHTLSLFTGRSGNGFAARSIRAKEVIGAGLEEIYVPKWTVTKGFELNDGHSCANMIDHFTPPAFFKTVRGMKHEQLFAEFNVSAARNLSLSSEEKDCLLGARDKEIEELKSQLLKAKEESVKVAHLRARVSGLEATENSLRGEVASTKEHNVLLEQECDSLKLKVTSLESTITEKDHELSDLGASSSSLKSQNQTGDFFHELREKLEMYEGSLKQLEEFQDNLMRPLETRWLLTHGMKLLVVKCLNSTEYMEALGHAFGHAIKKGMQEGLAAGIEHGQAGRCLTDLEAYIPSAEADFNSDIRDLRDLNFLLLQELSNKKDASTWDIIDLLRLDDTMAETLGMTDLQPDVSQLMILVHHKQDRVVIGSQALSVALDIFGGQVEKMERNLVERLLFLKDVFSSIDDPLSVEALIEPLVEVPATNVLSTMVIVPHFGPSVSVKDYDNPDSVYVFPKNVTLGPEGEEKVDASTGSDLAFSKLDDEARDAVFLACYGAFYTAATCGLFVVVLGSSLPSRSFNLYDPFPSASVTWYGPSHLGLYFPVSSTRLASLLRYTKSPGLKLAFLTLVL